MVVIQEEDPYRTKPLLRDISGRVCKKLPKTSPWPFAQWDIDIVGPFLRVTRNQRWLIVGTNYFTKWVEIEPLSNIRDLDAKRYIWKNIVTRVGVPHTLILDNELQFDSKVFQRYCYELGYMIISRYCYEFDSIHRRNTQNHHQLRTKVLSLQRTCDLYIL